MDHSESSSKSKQFPEKASTEMEEAMWSINLADDESSQGERPRTIDCANFIISGTCKYGSNCHYNHPHDRVVVTTGSETVEPKQHVTRSACRYFLRDGYCMYGDSCWFEHPKQSDGSDESLQPLTLNRYGYPRHQDKKECAFYMRTGRCKFGLDCKFDHPDPPAPSPYMPASSTPHFVMPPPTRPFSSFAYTNPTSWEVGSYPPVLFSPGAISVPSWNTYDGRLPVCPSYAQYGPGIAGAAGMLDHPVHVGIFTPPAPVTSVLLPSIVAPNPMPFSRRNLLNNDSINNDDSNDNDNNINDPLSSPSAFPELHPEVISSIESLLSSTTPPPSEIGNPDHDILSLIFPRRVTLPTLPAISGLSLEPSTTSAGNSGTTSQGDQFHT